MMNRRLEIVIVLVATSAVTGCAHSVDLTNTPEIRQIGMIGREVVLAEDVYLCDTGFRPYTLGLLRANAGPREVGRLSAGTRMRLEKFEYFDRIFFLKPDYTELPVAAEFTLARIETGPHAGLLVDTGGIGVTARSAILPDGVRWSQ